MPEHTIAENLSRLITAKTDITNAITTQNSYVSAGHWNRIMGSIVFNE